MKAVPASVLICVVLTSGALFGMAAQAALDHLGLGLAGVRDDLIVDQVARSRSAFAWWAWWFVPVAAFLVGPLSAAATRYLVANWWLLRGLRHFVSAALMLGLAIIGHLPAAPSTFDVKEGAAVTAAVALVSAGLAALGARAVRVGRRRRAGPPGPDDRRSRDFDPVAAPLPRRGGGSVEPGPSVGRWGRGFRRLGRLALAGVLALVVLAAVSALSGAAVVLELVTPGAMRQLIGRSAPPAAGRPVHTVPAPEMPARETQTRAMGFAPRPAGEVARPHIAIVPTIAESELTFAQGYARRRAAQDAADQRAAREAAAILVTALQFQIKMPDKLRSRAVTLQRAERDGRPPRHVAADRRARDPNHGDRRYAVAHDPDGAHQRYAVVDPPGSRRRQTADSRHGGRTRHGDQYRYARYDHFGFAGF